MDMQRTHLDHFWLTVATQMAQAERLLDLPGALSEGMRLTIGRLLRMAVFMVQRLTAAEALKRLAAGERAPDAPCMSPPCMSPPQLHRKATPKACARQ